MKLYLESKWPFGHKHSFNNNHYMRRNPNYRPVDGIGCEHFIIEAKCETCDQWFQVGRIHGETNHRKTSNDH